MNTFARANRKRRETEWKYASRSDKSPRISINAWMKHFSMYFESVFYVWIGYICLLMRATMFFLVINWDDGWWWWKRERGGRAFQFSFVFVFLRQSVTFTSSSSSKLTTYTFSLTRTLLYIHTQIPVLVTWVFYQRKDLKDLEER